MLLKIFAYKCIYKNVFTINIFFKEEELDSHDRKKAKKAKAVDSSEEEEEGMYDTIINFFYYSRIMF